MNTHCNLKSAWRSYVYSAMLILSVGSKIHAGYPTPSSYQPSSGSSDSGSTTNLDSLSMGSRYDPSGSEYSPDGGAAEGGVDGQMNPTPDCEGMRRKIQKLNQDRAFYRSLMDELIKERNELEDALADYKAAVNDSKSSPQAKQQYEEQIARTEGEIAALTKRIDAASDKIYSEDPPGIDKQLAIENEKYARLCPQGH